MTGSAAAREDLSEMPFGSTPTNAPSGTVEQPAKHTNYQNTTITKGKAEAEASNVTQMQCAIRRVRKECYRHICEQDTRTAVVRGNRCPNVPVDATK